MISPIWMLVDLRSRPPRRTHESIRTKLMHTRLAEFMTTRSAAECQRKCAEMKNNFSASANGMAVDTQVCVYLPQTQAQTRGSDLSLALSAAPPTTHSTQELLAYHRFLSIASMLPHAHVLYTHERTEAERACRYGRLQILCVRLNSSGPRRRQQRAMEADQVPAKRCPAPLSMRTVKLDAKVCLICHL